VIRAADDRVTPLDPGRILETKDIDRKKSFTTDAALHIVNQASTRDLKRRVEERYPEGLENIMIDNRNWRANIYIDTKNAYDEDLFTELRFGTCIARTVGPSVRCKAIQCNYDV